MSDESNFRTLFLGNIAASVDVVQLRISFSATGLIKDCKIIRESDTDAYALVEFTNHESAKAALAAVDKTLFVDEKPEVDWVTNPVNQHILDPSNHDPIYIGDLSSKITIPKPEILEQIYPEEVG